MKWSQRRDHAQRKQVHFVNIQVGWCHGSAGTPLGTHANGEASRSEEARQTLQTLADHDNDNLRLAHVTVLMGKTPDSVVMTTRAGKYH
jgi:hypothetical protein